MGFMYAQTCSMAELGNLSSPIFAFGGSCVGASATHSDYANGACINGVQLPDSVIEELRKLGVPLYWYSRSELEDAVQACAYDRHLVDDEHGITFRDKLSLTYEEKIAMERSRKRKTKLHICSDDDEDHFLQN